MKRIAISVAALLLGGNSLAADRVDYLREIKPILKERCFACHGALKRQAGLRLDAAALLRRGGDSGAAVVAGKPGQSLLLHKVSAADESERMPPEGQPLTARQIERLKAWIEQGAQAPADDRPEEDPRSHWAFRPPARMAVPSLGRDPEKANPIDAFLAAERKKRGLRPVPLADKRLLLRRVYLDLIGLPPTREQMQAFLADDSSQAYERVVDELLRSPHYGERWGRHWMDVWRYTDWFGLGAQLRYSQKHIWRWRDWIIESLNADSGYDRMVLLMLAADELAPTDRDALRATGFLARNYFLFNRTTWLDDTIEHTSKAFLGLTMNCAKCHDHKYDPITQLDYYRLRAIFEPHQVRLDVMPGELDLEKDGLPRVFDAHPDAPTYLHIRGNAKDPDKNQVIKPGVPEVLALGELNVKPTALPPEAHYPALQAFVLEDHLRVAEKEIAAARAALDEARKQLAQSSRETSQPAEKTYASGDVFLKDDFAKARPDVWQTGPGKWAYRDGKLVQSQTGAARAYLRSRRAHPADFLATLKFKTTGGQKWKSVGLAFDVVEGREKLVYLSAVSPGAKLQAAYKTGANHVYPPGGKQDRPVNVGEIYELAIAARGPLLNVAVNGRHALAYRFPVKREAGRIDLVAFDAAVEFHGLEIRALPSGVKLVETNGPSQTARPVTAEAARAAVRVAEKALAAAELKPAMLRAAHAADRAKADAARSAPATLAAALAARKYELAKAEQAVAIAEQKAKANSALQTARANLEKAKRSLQEPGMNYTSLRASLKALEGPDETDASRRRPYPKTSTGRRTALARWIVDRHNPLTARVAVNHIWLRHFGQPLVESVTDFGRRAKRPRQYALLDWLAVELMENGWKMKRLHRLLVTSQAYRLGSSTAAADEATQAADPENEFYWRRKPVRMESQVVRDSLLHLAGALDPALGGPTVDPDKAGGVYRRSIYFTHSRDKRDKFLSMFNDADILRCYRRSESIIPQQALTLANSKLALTMARRIAAKLEERLGGASDEKFIEEAFAMVLASRPTREEASACLAAMNQTRNLLAQRKQPRAAMRARENLVHALINHNDFITIR